jgi:RNA polymerase primary sigma factor
MAASSNPSDILSTYTNDIARHKMLDPDAERELGYRALDGDEAAQVALVNANLRFTITIAKRYKHHGVPLMDLIQAGNIGLTHAAKKFDPSVGVRFISYAVFWISQQIQKEIDANNGSVRATQTQMVRLRRVRRLQSEAKQRLGRELTMDELKQETGYTEARIEEAMDYRVTIKSLDEPVNPSEGASTTLAQVIGFDDGRAEIEQDNETTATVHQVLKEILSDRERQVLAEYYGFGGKRELSLTEIGQMRGISRERARQLKERALKKIRAAKQHHGILKDVFRTREEAESRAARGLPERMPVESLRSYEEHGLTGESVFDGEELAAVASYADPDIDALVAEPTFDVPDAIERSAAVKAAPAVTRRKRVPAKARARGTKADQADLFQHA